jgi:hypothetical protein
MKKLPVVFTIALLTAWGTLFQPAQAQVSVNIDFNTFYNELSPYGRWVNNARYGRVWVCNETGFQPYSTNGHWVYTDEGWTWVSDYPWGWAPFHYGRWDYDPAYGWFWVPGYEWAPAWVSWRSGGDYYGWAPLSPGLSVSVGVSFGAIPASHWVFVPHQYITSPSIHNYYINNSRNVTIIKNTTVINNVRVVNNNSRVNYVAGPQRAEVERITHRSVRPVAISNAARPGRTVINNNTVNIYRPVVNRTTNVNVHNNITNNNRVNNPHTAVRPAQQTGMQPRVNSNIHRTPVQQQARPSATSRPAPVQVTPTPRPAPVHQAQPVARPQRVQPGRQPALQRPAAAPRPEQPHRDNRR